MMQVKERNSIFELVRIIAMLFIVVYHLLLFCVAPQYPDQPLFKGLQIPLHIGVLLFVLISGYFGIKCTFKGLFKLIMMVVVYYIPITLSTDLLGGSSIKYIIKDCLFISYSPYWFIRTYICLYIFSPVLNKYLEGITAKQRNLLIASLGFISVYLGTSMGDSSLSNGKNLINFALLYVLGNTLFVYKHKWERWSNRLLIPSYLLLNLLLVSSYCLFANTFISKVIWRISFPYCSPILIINALLFFIIFAKYQLSSKMINTIASSMFAVYLIHCQPFIEKVVIAKVATMMFGLIGSNVLLTIVSIILLGVGIIIFCVMIDRLLNPLWKYLNHLGDKLTNNCR